MKLLILVIALAVCSQAGLLERLVDRLEAAGLEEEVGSSHCRSLTQYRGGRRVSYSISWQCNQKQGFCERCYASHCKTYLSRGGSLACRKTFLLAAQYADQKGQHSMQHNVAPSGTGPKWVLALGLQSCTTACRGAGLKCDPRTFLAQMKTTTSRKTSTSQKVAILTKRTGRKKHCRSYDYNSKDGEAVPIFEVSSGKCFLNTWRRTVVKCDKQSPSSDKRRLCYCSP